MRRWFQFSLRSLLVLMLVVAAYCSGWKSSQWKHEKELREAQRQAEEQAAALRAQNAAAQTTIWLNGSGLLPYNTALNVNQPFVWSQPGYVPNTSITLVPGVDVSNSITTLQPMQIYTSGMPIYTSGMGGQRVVYPQYPGLPGVSAGNGR